MIVSDSELLGMVSFGTQPLSSDANRAQGSYLPRAQLWEGPELVGASSEASTPIFSAASLSLTLHLSTPSQSDRWDQSSEAAESPRVPDKPTS